MSCMDCTEEGSPEWSGMWDWYGCLGGTLYGECEYEGCGGLCDYRGPCDCECHQ